MGFCSPACKAGFVPSLKAEGLSCFAKLSHAPGLVRSSGRVKVKCGAGIRVTSLLPGEDRSQCLWGPRVLVPGPQASDLHSLPPPGRRGVQLPSPTFRNRGIGPQSQHPPTSVRLLVRAGAAPGPLGPGPLAVKPLLSPWAGPWAITPGGPQSPGGAQEAGPEQGTGTRGTAPPAWTQSPGSCPPGDSLHSVNWKVPCKHKGPV